MGGTRIVVDNLTNPLDLKGLRVGLVYWNKLANATNYQQLFEYMGMEVVSFPYNEIIPDGLDVVFARGPNGSLAPIANQLNAMPPSRRVPFIYLLTEPLPHPNTPQWLLYWIGKIRSRLERLSYRQGASGQWEKISHYSSSFFKAHRFNYYGDLLWMKSKDILSVLAISSEWNALYLRSRGFDPLVLPLAYPRIPGVNFRNPRDISVLWLGKVGSERRGRLLKRIRNELTKRGVDMLVIDGKENPYIFGKKRDELLSRTRIVLNIIRQWWDDNSLRYLLAIPRGSLIVTEPTLPHTSFKPGLHLVEAPVEQIAEKICYYLANETERIEIVERAYQELTRRSPLDVMRAPFEKAIRNGRGRVHSAVSPVEDFPAGQLANQ